MTEASEARDVLVGQFTKNSLQVVKVMRRRFKGQSLVDVRIFYKETDAMHGEVWSPSKAGIALRREQVPEFIRLLSRAYADGDAETE